MGKTIVPDEIRCRLLKKRLHRIEILKKQIERAKKELNYLLGIN